MEMARKVAKAAKLSIKNPSLVGKGIKNLVLYGTRGVKEKTKEELVKIVLESMNEHFLKLRDSDREEIREFYPGKTAEEMFLI